MSHHQVVYGKPPSSLPQYVTGSSNFEAVEHELSERKYILEKLKDNLLKAQSTMKKNDDMHHIPHPFKLGDQVLVRLRPYRQTFVAGQRVQKLSKRFYGPFPIKKCIGEVAFELEQPKESKIHPVFHAFKLKPFHGDIDNKELALSSALVEGDPPQELVLVQWDGLFSEDST